MTNAERAKLARSRRAMGLAVYRVEVGGDVLSALCGDLIEETEIDNLEAVQGALSAALRQWAEWDQSSRVTRILAGRPYVRGKGESRR